MLGVPQTLERQLPVRRNPVVGSLAFRRRIEHEPADAVAKLALHTYAGAQPGAFVLLPGQIKREQPDQLARCTRTEFLDTVRCFERTSERIRRI